MTPESRGNAFNVALTKGKEMRKSLGKIACFFRDRLAHTFRAVDKPVSRREEAITKHELR